MSAGVVNVTAYALHASTEGLQLMLATSSTCMYLVHVAGLYVGWRHLLPLFPDRGSMQTVGAVTQVLSGGGADCQYHAPRLISVAKWQLELSCLAASKLVPYVCAELQVVPARSYL